MTTLQNYYQQYLDLTIKKNLKGKEALEAVKQNGDALKFVNEQTEETCLEAVKQNGYALQYVNEQTEEICLEAVKQYGYALKYVNENMFKEALEEMTLEEVCKELGKDIKIIK